MISFPNMHTDVTSLCLKCNCKCIGTSFTNALDMISKMYFMLPSLVIARSHEGVLQSQLQGIQAMYSSSYIDKNYLDFYILYVCHDRSTPEILGCCLSHACKLCSQMCSSLSVHELRHMKVQSRELASCHC